MHHTACAAFRRVAGYWHMLPEYAQARKAIWDSVNPHTGKRRIDEAFPKEIRATTRDQEMQIVLQNGSTWQVVGSDRFDALVGSSPAGIVYSEWALSNPSVRAYLRPILAENNGWQIFNTTPRGRNHAYTTMKAAERDPQAFAQILDATQTGIFSTERLAEELAAYIAEFGEDYGRAKFEQEYLCSFDAANLGAILARSLTVAERSDRITDRVVFDPKGQALEISADIGRRDTSTWWFWQPCIGGYRIIDYDGGFGLDADEWAERLKVRLDKYRLYDATNPEGKDALGKIWLPHDAQQKSFAAKRSAVESFQHHFGSARVWITPMTSKADRINAARVLMPRIAFHETNCARGIEGLRSWSFEYDAEKKMFSSEPRHDWASHDGDGFSYGCVVMSQQKPPKPEDKTRFALDQTIDELIKKARRRRLENE